MSDSRLQSALREMQRHFTDPRVLGGMAIIGLLLGFAGPFGTYELLPLVPRLVYWLAMVVATYGVGFACSVFGRRLFERRLPRRWPRLLLLGVLSGVPITAAVLVVNLLTFGAEAFEVIALAELWLNVTLISVGVMVVSLFLERAMRQDLPTASVAQPTSDSPALLERLPPPQRGPLVSLSVTDHYVDVVTSRGHALVLMRLSDAIRETAPTPGLQIHRSHWVALDAIARAVRADGKLSIELTDGRRLPVSRSYAPAVRQAGFG